MSVRLGDSYTVPYQPHHASQDNGYGRAQAEPATAEIARGRHHNPPWIVSQAPPVLETHAHVASLPQPVYGSINQSDGRGVQTAQDRPDHPHLPHRVSDAQYPMAEQ